MFQSTHPHGVRQEYLRNLLRQRCFNPRTRTGCDKKGGKLVIKVSVSIHAPARGATNALVMSAPSMQVSIHAPARGATGVNSYVITSPLFQSTHPHGVRPAKGNQPYGGVASFNPRTRTGCDTSPNIICMAESCFNPRTRTGCDVRHRW